MLRPQLFPNFSKPGPSKLGPYDSEPEIRLAPAFRGAHRKFLPKRGAAC